ncbi:RNA methyltransferase tRNA(m5U54)methyltransferase [Microbotryomycetes sp. JL201]|nr:RNA methyltransferase tRNA(m5U54)methyltransferase [Microbotryomycetes sp. JL201]
MSSDATMTDAAPSIATPAATESDSSINAAPPAGFVAYTEATTSILFATPDSALANQDKSTQTPQAPVFLNPVQEYNRDLSVVAIRAWSERRQTDKAAYWEEGVRRKWARRRARAEREEQQADETASKKRKVDASPAVTSADVSGDLEAKSVPATEPAPGVSESSVSNINTTARPVPSVETVLTPPRFKFTLLEALSATGLRAIRYAKEIPLLRYVVANDLSSSAVQDIKRNVEYNGLTPRGLPATTTSTAEGDINETQGAIPPVPLSKAEKEDLILGRVRVNEGDACVKMYNHRAEALRFDCIDLDPYGSAVPFLDAAVGAVADGGLLCITCTDAGVLAGHNYPEKAFTHYGGVCVNAEYSHEVGLRLVLNALAQTAARYGRHIEPLLSLSIDFYVRLFVKINTGKIEVKALPSKTSLLYYCHSCQTPTFQPFGRVNEKRNQKNGAVNYTYHSPTGPPVGEQCANCGGRHSIGGPMWSGPLHNKSFIDDMLGIIEEDEDKFKTASRIQGMLNLARNELDAPFYFTPSKTSGLFNAISPSLQVVGSALLNAGYKISRSHASSGSIKTDAPRAFVHDIYREWIKKNPVNMKNVKDGSMAQRMLSREQKHVVDLTMNPDVDSALLTNNKLVMYQMNPQANWGPARAAVKGCQLLISESAMAMPEHFSSPLLQLAAKDESIKLVSCPSGTGQIMSALKNNEIDLAIALTESLIAGNVKQTADFKLVGTYVTSPLNWAVIVGKDSPYHKLEDLRGHKIGISRVGSGSQVMASYMYLREKWLDSDGSVEPIQFEVLDSFQNLRDGVNDGRAAAFLWEHFTSKPWLNKTIRFVGSVPTPWPSWSIVASRQVLNSEESKRSLQTFLSNLTEHVHAFDKPEARASSSKDFIKEQFGYPEEDVEAWLAQVSYPKSSLDEIKRDTIDLTLSTLEAAGVLQKPESGWNFESIVDTSVAKLV